MRQCWVFPPASFSKTQRLPQRAAQAGFSSPPDHDAFSNHQQHHQPGYREQLDRLEQEHAPQAGHHVHYLQQAAASPSHSQPHPQRRAQGRQHVFQMAAAPAAAVPNLRPGRWMGFFTTICGTLAALAAFATALILFVRPLLKASLLLPAKTCLPQAAHANCKCRLLQAESSYVSMKQHQGCGIVSSSTRSCSHKETSCKA